MDKVFKITMENCTTILMAFYGVVLTFIKFIVFMYEY